jgi:hypothetical protein
LNKAALKAAAKEVARLHAENKALKAAKQAALSKAREGEALFELGQLRAPPAKAVDGVRIATLDIETAPLESYTWGIWEQNVGLDMIKTEWSILSFSWKWLGEKVAFHCTGGRGAGKVRDDSVLMKELWSLLNEADLVIAQNGIKFDIKKVNARLIMHGFGPYSPVRVIDTLANAKRRFAFTSNKLEWQSKYLTDSPKSKHKKFPGFELWQECLNDNPEAWKEMEKYNKQDVISTEKLYMRQRPWIPNHPNIGTFNILGDVQCPTCGAAEIIEAGARVLQNGSYRQYHCRSCGAWSRGKKMLAVIEARRVKLAALT